MLDSNQYIFKIDSSYRLKSFRLFFLSLPEEEEFTIKEIKAFNKKGGEFNFSLKSKDLVRTDNLSLSNLISNELCIRKVSKNITTTPSLYFDMSDSFDGLFIKSDKRALEIPSFPASIIILLLGILMAYTIYPTIFSLKLKGVNPGAYFLALALLILPTGEKATNLLLSIAIVTGIIFSLRESTLLCKIRDNRLLLAVSVFTVAIYTIAFLLSARDGQSANIYKIKMGIPLTLFALCVNINTKSEIRLQLYALIIGVIVSVFLHFGWIIIFIDSVSMKSKLLSFPRYYLESSVFSRVHHLYLSLVSLICLIIILFNQDILSLKRKEKIIYSILIGSLIFLAFSRAAILSFALILIFFIIGKIFNNREFKLFRIAGFSAAFLLSFTLLGYIFINFNNDISSPDSSISGLTIRLDLWENAKEIIKQKPIFGWGPEGYSSALKELNLSRSNNINSPRNLNTHNQFLETSGMFGIMAGIGLIWFILFPMGFTVYTSQYSRFVFFNAIIFISAFLFESFLNRNLGILIFAITYGFLIKLNPESPINQKNNI